MIVEDDEATVRVLERVLSETHEMQTALSGPEALEGFAPDRYDVALIDLALPGMPGDEVARQIRQLDPSVALVLITGWELQQGDPRLAAFDLQIHKPIDDLDTLEHIVARAVELHDTRAEER